MSRVIEILTLIKNILSHDLDSVDTDSPQTDEKAKFKDGLGGKQPVLRYQSSKLGK